MSSAFHVRGATTAGYASSLERVYTFVIGPTVVALGGAALYRLLLLPPAPPPSPPLA